MTTGGHDALWPRGAAVALVWALAAFYAYFLRPVFWEPIVLGTLAMAFWRGYGAWRQIRERIGENATLTGIAMEKLVGLATSGRGLYIGEGFVWQRKEALEARSRLLAGETPHPPGRLFTDSGRPPVGDAWIDRLGRHEALFLGPEALAGHTLIAGTTGAGKTRLYELLSTQIITQGSTLIVIDPKGDIDWKNRIEAVCRACGRRFLHFSVAHPAESIRMQPLMNWEAVSEPASRLSALVKAEGAFLSFGWRTFFVIMRAMVADGRKPTIREARDYVIFGVEPLLTSLIEKYFVAMEGPRWEEAAASIPRPSLSRNVPVKSERLAMLMLRYENKKYADEVIGALTALLCHPREHYQKMIQTVQPILSMLGDEDIGRLLSPDPLDAADTRPIYDMMGVMKQRAVLYVGLNTLANRIVGQAVGSMLLADLASAAGAVYNAGTKGEPVYLMVDEAAEVMNDSAIQILNKGRGAGLRVMVATQTIADFDALFGSHAKTRQMLGNLNNIISLRIKDMEMAAYITEAMGQALTERVTRSVSKTENSSRFLTEFGASTVQSATETDVPLVPAELLARLPPLHYFAFVAGGRLYKARLPLINPEVS